MVDDAKFVLVQAMVHLVDGENFGEDDCVAVRKRQEGERSRERLREK